MSNTQQKLTQCLESVRCLWRSPRIFQTRVIFRPYRAASYNADKMLAFLLTAQLQELFHE